MRSLVRIPGTGHVKKKQPTMLDLSKVSTMVAASRTGGLPLPLQLLRSTIEENNEDLSKKKKRKREEEEQSTPSPLQNEEEESKKKKRTTISIPMIRLVRPTTTTNTTVGSNATAATAAVVVSQRVVTCNVPLQQLIAQRDRLAQENMELRKRLVLFQQLFRDKERLKSVVNHIMQQ